MHWKRHVQATSQHFVLRWKARNGERMEFFKNLKEGEELEVSVAHSPVLFRTRRDDVGGVNMNNQLVTLM